MENQETKSKKKLKIYLILILAALAILLFCIIFFCVNNKKEYFNVTFEINGGTLISGDLTQTVKKGGRATAPDCEKTGYSLIWDTVFDNVESNLTVKAIWTAKKYSVTLSCNNNTPNIVEIVTYDEEFEFDVPLKNNYYFDGFYNAGNNRFTNFESTGIGLWKTDSDITLYANWIEGTAGITYELDTTTGTYVASEYSPSGTEKAIVVAGAFNNKPVTKIANGTFQYKLEGIEELLLPYGIEEIGENAFYNNDLYNCKIKSIIFPKTLKTISNNAFWNFHYVEYLYVPASVESIGGDAFAGFECTIAIFKCNVPSDASPFTMYGSPLRYVKLILVPDEYLMMYEEAWFNDIYGISTLRENCALDGDKYISYFGQEKVIIIPDNIKEIANACFVYNNIATQDIIEEIILPEGLEKIGRYAFYERKNILNITIPASVSELTASAFSGWTEEQTIHVTRSSAENWLNENWYNVCNAKIVDEFGIEIVF